MLEEYYRVVYRVLKVKYKSLLYFKKYEFNKLYIKYLDLVIFEDQVI